MANVLTAVAPILYSAARKVPRELVGVLGAVTRDFNDKGVAKGDTVRVPVSPIATTAAFTASQTFAAGTDRTPTTKILTLTNEQVSSWNLTAEEERSLENSTIAQDVLAQTVQQHLRAHVNTVEAYTWGVAHRNASRSVGTAGTTPFGTNANILANVHQILADNGTENADLSVVMNTNAGTQLRQVANLYKVNEAGDADLLRKGVLGALYNMDLRESAAITTVTSGTGTNYTSDTTGYAIGSTSITLITGSGTILAGDTVTFTGDTNKYIVATGNTVPGVIVLQEPGLKVALATSAVAMTIGTVSTRNIALHRKGVVAVMRPGIQPVSPATDQMVLTDAVSGVSVLLYRNVGHGMSSWYMRSVYDAFAPNPYAIAQLLG